MRAAPFIALLTLALVSPEALGAEPNRLTLGEGAVVVRARPEAELFGQVALDGSDQTRAVGYASRQPLPLQVVIELPAATTLEHFVLPEFNDYGAASGHHVRTLRVEGSSQGPDEGFSSLTELVLAQGVEGPQRFVVASPRPVRWLRLTAVDTHQPPSLDHDPHNFTELMGFGPQEAIAPGRFEGIWRFRRKGLNDPPGVNLIALRQEASGIRGCQRLGGSESTISGAVEGGLARLVSTDDQGNQTAFTAVITRSGELSGVSFSSSVTPFHAAPDPAAALPSCMPVEADNPVEQALADGRTAVLYGIQFDVDSANLKPTAEAALSQVLGSLRDNDRRVVIEGHTDSDGDDAHNQALSERRAQAVMTWLTARGIEPGRLEAVGRGEAVPLADNRSSAGRALNRRVELRAR